LLLLRLAFGAALLRFGVAAAGIGTGEALACPQAAIGLAIHNNDSNLAGVFMAILGAPAGCRFFAR
jgi:hypothetical protein